VERASYVGLDRPGQARNHSIQASDGSTSARGVDTAKSTGMTAARQATWRGAAISFIAEEHDGSQQACRRDRSAPLSGIGRRLTRPCHSYERERDNRFVIDCQDSTACSNWRSITLR
jgi:hypothetical protein